MKPEPPQPVDSQQPEPEPEPVETTAAETEAKPVKADQVAASSASGQGDERAQDAAQTGSNAGQQAGNRNGDGQGEGAQGSADGQDAGGGPVGTQQDYLARLRAWLERHKEYPRRARLRRLEGIVTLRLVLGREGQVLDYSVADNSGHKILDEAGMAMVERARPLPEIPESMGRDRLVLQVPVHFGLR